MQGSLAANCPGDTSGRAGSKAQAKLISACLSGGAYFGSATVMGLTRGSGT